VSLQRRILCIFWAIHLALCVLWVLPDKLSAPRSRALRFLLPYGLYTGAGNKYAFFAPNVPSARRVRIRVLCGGEWIPFETAVNSSESLLRLHTITSMMMRAEVEEQLGASWAAFALGRTPCAKAALVEEDYYGIPAVSDYRRGERPGWNLLHVQAFMTKEELKATEEARQ
jgi:hypothetical protein